MHEDQIERLLELESRVPGNDIRRYKIRNVPEKVIDCSANESPKNEDVTTEFGGDKSEDLTLSSTKVDETGDSTHNNIILSFAGGSIAVLTFLINRLSGVKVYKAKFLRRSNFYYRLSEDNGNIFGDDNRVNCQK